MYRISSEYIELFSSLFCFPWVFIELTLSLRIEAMHLHIFALICWEVAAKENARHTPHCARHSEIQKETCDEK